MSEKVKSEAAASERLRVTRRPIDWPCVGLMTISLAAHATLVAIFYLQPPEPRVVSLDMITDSSRFTRYILAPEVGEVRVPDWPQNSDDGMMGGGSDGRRFDNRFGIKGSTGSDVFLARAGSGGAPPPSGVLDALRGGLPSSPFGQDRAAVSDPDSLGGLLGHKLGARGTGRGGGGEGAVGLGNLNTIGHGGGGGTGSGYGRGSRSRFTPLGGPTHPLPSNGVLTSNFVGGHGVETRLDDLLDRGVMVDGRNIRLEAFRDRGALPYAVPRDGAVALYAEMERSRVVTDSDRVHLQLALVSRRGELPERPRMDVRLVLDRSGSMDEPGKWNNAVASVHALADQLQPSDTFGLITYSDEASLDLVPQRVGSQERVHRVIDEILSRRRPGGGTNISDALELASGHRPRRREPTDLGLVVLISDGNATVGMTNPRELGTITREMFDESGVLTTTIGLGTDFSEETMLTVAREGNGSYHFVRRPSEIASIVEDELTQRAQAVAQALRLRVVLEEGVVVRRVYGSRLLSEQEHSEVRATEVATDHRLARELGISRDRSRENEEGLRIHLGSFRRGDQHVVLMELELPPGQAASQSSVAQVFLEYKDLASRSNQRLEREVAVERVSEPDEAHASVRRTVKRTVLAFQAGEALQQAAEALRMGEIATARRVLSERRELLETAADLWRDPALREDAGMIERYETVLARAYPSWNDQDQRTLLLAMAYYGDRRMR